MPRRLAPLLLVVVACALGTGHSQADGSVAARKVTVPRVVGLLKTNAVVRLQRAHLRTTAVSVHSNALVGTVLAQKPSAGSKVLRGTRVRITVSSGPGP